MILEQNHVNSRRLLSLFAALFIVSFCFVGLIPHAYATPTLTSYTNVNLSDGVYLIKSGFNRNHGFKLYVDEDTPLSVNYLLEHPNEYVKIESTTTMQRFYVHNSYMGVMVYSGDVLNKEWVETKLMTKTNWDKCPRDAAIILGIYEDGALQYDWTLTSYFEPKNPFSDVLDSISTASSVVFAVVLIVLSTIMNYPLLLLPIAVVFVGIGIGVFLKIKRV